MSSTLLTSENHQTSPQVSSHPATYAVSLRLSQISRDGGTQARAEINYSVVEEYAAALQAGATFPPVTLYYDGEFYWLADGFHRVLAAEAADIERIAADIRQGSRRDAVLHSVGANACHGLRRTNVDKQRAVETLLQDEEWGKWSDNAIAKACGVSHPFVAKIRAKLPLSCNRYKIERTAQRNGIIYTQNIAKIGGTAGVVQGSEGASNPQTQATEQLKLTALKERDRIVVTDSHPLFAGQHGVITGRPTADAAIVALDEGARERISIRQLQRESLKPPRSVVVKSIQPNSDVPPDDLLATSASSLNAVASAHGKPDIIASEITIGIRYLTPEQLAWVISAASEGLSDSHLKAVIKAAKQVLNERHYPRCLA